MNVSEAVVQRHREVKDTEIRRAQRELNLKTGANLKAVEVILAEKRASEIDKPVIVSINPNTEINDKMFVEQSIIENGVTKTIMAFPKELHEVVLRIMCSITEAYKEAVSFMLKKPELHKDIQFLENYGIKMRNLAIMFYECCGDDIEALEITLFLFRFNFFSKEEILENISSPEPISFYDSNAADDLHKAKQITGDMSELTADIKEMLENLRTKVRENYFQRKTNNESREYILEPKREG